MFRLAPTRLTPPFPPARSDHSRPKFPNFLEGYGDIGSDRLPRMGPPRSASVDTTAKLRAAAPAANDAAGHGLSGGHSLNRSVSTDPYGTQYSQHGLQVRPPPGSASAHIWAVSALGQTRFVCRL